MSYQFSERACYVEGCGEVIVAHRDIDRRRRRTGETFHCPAGHRQHYIVGKTDEQKRIESLQAEVKRLTRRSDHARKRAERAWRTCPWVGCEFVAASGTGWDRRPLHSHMRAAHGMPTVAEVRDEDEAVAS